MRKNYIYLLFSLLLIGGTCYTLLSDTTSNGYHKDESSSENLINQQIQKKVERRKNGYAKPDKPDAYLEYIHMLKTGWNPNENYAINNALNELKKAKLKAGGLKAAKALDWKQRGPGNVGGRTRGLVVDPDDPTANTWFTGPVGGGVWKTTDAGANWACLTLDWPNLSVSSLVMAASNHNVMYAGTGEGFGNLDAIKGNGIFKTSDKGINWVQLSSTAADSNFEYINRIIVDPADENVVIAATNTGIFRSADGGASWSLQYSNNERVQDLRAKNDDFKTQIATVNDIGIILSVDGGVSWKMAKEITDGRIELCVSKSNPEYLYAMTAEDNIYLSTDGGDNWQQTTASAKVEFTSGQGWYNNTMVADPTDENILFVGGVETFKVTIGADAQTTGSEVYDVVLENTSFLAWKDMGGQYYGGGIKVNTANAALYKDVVISFGAGLSQKAHRFTSSSAALNPDASEFVYADYITVPFAVTDKTTGAKLMVSFRDDNASGAFEIGNGMEQIFVHSADYNDTEPLAEITAASGIVYNQIISMNPVLIEGATWDAANLPEASITLDNYTLKSKTISSVKKSVWWPSNVSNYSHADHHNLTVVERVGTPYRIIDCNDGGVFVSDDGGNSWSERVAGYVTTQFYGISKHPSKEIYLGGTQDNGTWLSGENPGKLSDWTDVLGGDGFETAWSAADANKMAISLYYNEIKLSYDGGQNWATAAIGDMENGKAPFVTRIANEASNPDLLFVGGKSGVWRSQDFGKNWTLTSMPSGTWNYPTSNPHIAVSPVNSKYVWAGNAISGADALALSTDGGKTFAPVPKPNGVAAFISELIAHPTNEKGIYVMFAQSRHPKIFYSGDLGATWTDLSAFSNKVSTNGFPDVAVYSLAVMPYDTNILWAGTEIGIFESTDGGTSWHYANNGLPAVCIWDLKIVGQQLVVGTHGLGVWTLDLPQIAVDKAPLIVNGGKAPTGSFNLETEFYKSYEKVELYINDSKVSTIQNLEAGTQLLNATYQTSKQEVSCYLIAYNNNESEVQYSNYFWLANPAYETPVEKYMNSFSTRRYDFLGSDFTISKELFDDWAIHTAHPYAENKEIVYTLSYPIIVKESTTEAVLSYRDIALVEPGNQGTSFGDATYWDYVILEGTTDGINWKPLADGYDVDYSSKWQQFADNVKSDNGFDYKDINNVPNTTNLFVEHNLNLQPTFAPGDVVALRFRLFSDTYTAGWGWVIDDLIIQESGTSVDESSEDERGFWVGPNPATTYIEMKLQSKDRGDVSVVLYDLSGKPVVVRDYHKDIDYWSQQLQIGEISKGMKILTVTINGKTFKQKILVK